MGLVKVDICSALSFQKNTIYDESRESWLAVVVARGQQEDRPTLLPSHPDRFFPHTSAVSFHALHTLQFWETKTLIRNTLPALITDPSPFLGRNRQTGFPVRHTQQIRTPRTSGKSWVVAWRWGWSWQFILTFFFLSGSMVSFNGISLKQGAIIHSVMFYQRQMAVGLEGKLRRVLEKTNAF